MRGYEVAERAKGDVEALMEAHAIAYGALSYISEDAKYFERCKEVARRGLEDMQRAFARVDQ